MFRSYSHGVLFRLFRLLLQRVHACHDAHLRGWWRSEACRLHLLLLENVYLGQHYRFFVLILWHAVDVVQHFRQRGLMILMLMHSVCVHRHDWNELVGYLTVFNNIDLAVLAVD